MPEKTLAQQVAEHRVKMLLREEAAHRQSPTQTDGMLDDPKYRKYPEFRAELLKKLKELGRVSAEKD